jgi:adenylate cyclase
MMICKDTIIFISLEIERKFLVADDSWRGDINGSVDIVQGYLANTNMCSIRIRTAGEKASINLKSMTLDIVRTEYEYPLPLDEAQSILNSLCIQPLIMKSRYHITYKGHDWEVDEFKGDNNGLMVAEIELDNPNAQFEKPAWLGKEVSKDIRYYNVSLVDKPYKHWQDKV